jgi:1-acyl-sn-glycerol-3-phosphate acyltransferase
VTAQPAINDPNAIHYPRRRPIRWLLRNGIHLGLSLLADIQINGRENLPETGPLIIAGNHFHFLDPVAVIHLTRYPLEFIGGTRTPNAPGWTEMFRKGWGVLPIIRGGSSRDGLIRAQRILEQNGVLAIFPEGGSWAAVLRPPRPGAVLLAARTNARILPVGLDGFTEVFPSLSKRRRAKVTINIGKPFGPFQLDARGRSSRQAMDEMGHEIMRHIAELLPPQRRGFYSDDPAIREAAKGSEVYPWDGLVEN